jgi:hypothetical protein
MRVLSTLAGLLAVVTVGGCILVTGGTNGYTSAEGGSLSGQSCQSPKDCNGGPCCFVLSDAGLPSTTCQASCPAWEQSCTDALDCGDGGSCLTQTCTVEGMSGQVATCGPIPVCTQ